MSLSALPLPVLLAVAALAAAAMIRVWVPLMSTREQKIKVCAAAAVLLLGLGAFGGAKAGWSPRQILLYYAVMALSFAAGPLGQREKVRKVARREAEDGASKENQMPPLLFLQWFGSMGALFLLVGRLFDVS
ncbi:hypothetical protein AB0P17_18150 [Streptomyces sp. NPDC088124]|uniref:hypothetical protein n=1 Tax=Streptomyces sp. NPDC088124 TaxID=3154654 RepID=UPI0034285A76